jgi:hypothetical protein
MERKKLVLEGVQMARDKEIAPLVIFFAERTGAFPSKMWWKSGPVVEK